MRESTDLSLQPLHFASESSKSIRFDSGAFKGRVPIVLAFVGEHGVGADSLILSLDRDHALFGQRRVQLLVVVDGYPVEVSTRLGVSVPLITDDGLSERLNATTDDQGRISSVILGNDGRVLDVVRQLPTEDHAAAIFVALDRLALEFPDRLTVLPHLDENPSSIADPTSNASFVSAQDESVPTE